MVDSNSRIDRDYSYARNRNFFIIKNNMFYKNYLFARFTLYRSFDCNQPSFSKISFQNFEILGKILSKNRQVLVS